MPTSKRRVAITASTALEDALERLSKATGLPVATIARTFLEEAIPSLNELSEVLEAGKGEEVQRRWELMVRRLQGRVQTLPVELGGGG